MPSLLFDPTRDPFDAYLYALARAHLENKNVLLELGGDWCSWCHRLEKFIQESAELSGLRRQHYVTVKVYVSSEYADPSGFLQQIPPFDGVPHFFVYAPNGDLLCSQPTESLEEGSSYNHTRVRVFLERWTRSGTGSRPPDLNDRSVSALH